MNGPPILATLPSGLSDTERDRPRLLVYGVARRLLTGYWPCAFSWDTGEAFDGMIIGDAKAAREAEALLRQRRAWLAPIVDLTAQNLWFADYFADSATPSALRSGVERALDILASLGRLPTAVLETDDRETALLARVYSRGQRLEPTYDGAARQLLRYGLAGLIEQPAETAERLGQGGWFSRTFFDRLHFCPTCNSSRLSVREECSACRSTNVEEESVVNHFRCAHQAMERQFKQGEMLMCPKCRQRLRHFGVSAYPLHSRSP
jgi:Thaumarchaeal output domain 1